jgi:thymidylate synthase (FAD)
MMKVELIDSMGTDLSVVNAARVSYSKTKKTFEQSDEKLIKYLAEHEHWSPFAHASLQFRIKAPIFVARQLVKHQVGLVWNEVSRRYVDHAPELYKPDSWRGRPQNSKQGSDGEVELDQTINHNMETTMESCLILYNSLLQKGVAPEQARMVLPQSMMTEWYWSGKPDTQKETQDVANEIDKLADEVFPYCWKYLRK